MGMNIILKVIIIVAVLGIVVGGLGELDTHYGSASFSNSFNGTNNQQQLAYTANVYNPLTATVKSATQSANNESQASQASGFAYAFIIPQFGTIYSSLIGLPGVMGQYIGQMLTGLNIPGVNASAYAAVIDGLFLVVLALFALSLWFKLPVI